MSFSDIDNSVAHGESFAALSYPLAGSEVAGITAADGSVIGSYSGRRADSPDQELLPQEDRKCGLAHVLSSTLRANSRYRARKPPKKRRRVGDEEDCGVEGDGGEGQQGEGSVDRPKVERDEFAAFSSSSEEEHARSRGSKAARWTEWEEKRLMEGLRQLGDQVGLLAQLFPTRKQTQIRAKLRELRRRYPKRFASAVHANKKPDVKWLSDFAQLTASSKMRQQREHEREQRERDRIADPLSDISMDAARSNVMRDSLQGMLDDTQGDDFILAQYRQALESGDMPATQLGEPAVGGPASEAPPHVAGDMDDCGLMDDLDLAADGGAESTFTAES